MNSQNFMQNQYLCNVSDEIHKKNRYLNNVDDVRVKVCNDLPITKHTDEKHYCILHLPKKDKDEVLFNSIINSRIATVENEFINIENHIPDYQRSEAKSKLIYDFRYVWFPKEINLSKHIFVAKVDFSDATFDAGAYFNNSVFVGEARFVETKFNSSAKFSGAKFLLNANFLLASFSFAEFVSTTFSKKRETDFKQAKFDGDSWFSWTSFGHVDFSFANFSKEADFKSVTFSGESKFNQTKFSKTSKTSFYEAKFEKDTFFESTEFNNEVSFNSTLFGSDSDTIFREALFEKYVSFRYSTCEGYLRFIDVRQGKDCKLNFQEAAFEKASRISFYNLRLQPHWFINIDCQNFVLTNCEWKSEDYSKINLKSELSGFWDLIEIQSENRANQTNNKNLNANKLLSQTLFRLVVNYENNNRFEEASNFRQMAFECERLERKEKIRKWFQEPIKCSSLLGKIGEKIKSFPYDFIHWIYRWTSNYGESWGWATFVLITAVLFVFPIIYMFCEFQVAPKSIPLEVVVKDCKDVEPELKSDCKIEKRSLFPKEAVLHSLTSSIFQDVEYRRPISFWAELWTTLEKIFAPLQAALLALAIRRKFMR